MATMKKWFGLATLGAALAGLVARLRKKSAPVAETGEPEHAGSEAPMDDAEPMAEV